MKRKQLTAILLSAIMTVSACMPMNGISAFAAEDPATGGTEAAAIVEPVDEAQEDEQVEEPAEQEQENGQVETPVEQEEEPAEEPAEVPAEQEEEPAEESAEVPAEQEEEPAEEPAEAPAEQEEEPAEEPAEAPAEQEEVTEEETAEAETSNEAKRGANSQPSYDDFEDAGSISSGETVAVTINEDYPYMVLQFMPYYTANYAFYSKGGNGSLHPYAKLYDEDHNEITSNGDGSTDQFRIEYTLEEYTTYYYMVTLYSEEEEGDFTVCLENISPITYEVDPYYGEDMASYNEEEGYYECPVMPNEAVELRCSVYSYDCDISRLTYQWYEKTGDTYTIIEGANDTNYDLGTVSSNAWYKFEINDPYGETREVILYVYVLNNLYVYATGDDGWGEGEVEIYASAGQSRELSVDAEADDMSGLTYRWTEYYYDYETDEYVETEISGANSSSYTTEALVDNTAFRCYVADQYGNEAYAQFNVYVEEFNNNLNAHVKGEDDWCTYTYISVTPGKGRTLAVVAEANDTSQIKYQWYKITDDGYKAITGATKYYYKMSVAKAGEYVCKVTDQYGGECEVEFYVEVDNGLYAHVAGENRSYKTITVDPGASLSLSVAAEADDTSGITYEWLYSEDDGYNYETISGATGSEYTISSAARTAYYKCRVKDKYDNTDTVVFSVKINNNLNAHVYGRTKDQDYISYNVTPGEPVTLRVKAEADDVSQLTYSWRYDVGERIDDVDTDTYVFTPAASNNIECIVADQYGNMEYVHFYVRIDSGMSMNPVGEEGNALNEVYVYVPYGESITLDTGAHIEYGEATYEWNKEIDWSSEYIDGADSPTYTTEPIYEAVTYMCTMRDEYGNDETVYFYVKIDNELKAYPEGEEEGTHTTYIYAEPGTSVTLRPVVSYLDQENTEITYSWWNKYGDDGFDWSGDDALTVTVDNDAMYVCEIRDNYDNAQTVYFAIIPDTQLVAYPEGANVDANGNYIHDIDLYPEAGETLNLHVIATAGVDEVTYSWLETERYVTSWGEYEDGEETVEGENGEYLSVQANETTSYYCLVSDSYGGEITVGFHIHIGSLEAYPEGNPGTNRLAVTADKGATTTFSVETEAPSGSNLTYKWTSGPLNDSGWWPLEEGQDDSGSELTVTLNDSMRYLCVVSDEYGNQQLVYFYANVEGIKLNTNVGTPTLTGDNRYEIDVPVDVNQEITLQAIADTTEELTYYWMTGDMDDIRGATSDSLTVTGGEENLYICSVVDPNGNLYRIYFNMKADNQLDLKPAGTEDGTTEKYITSEKGNVETLAVEYSAIDEDDIDILWKDSIGRNTGTGDSLTVTVKGNTSYSCTVTDKCGNSKTVYFYIVTNDVLISDAKITLSESVFTYNGKEHKPTVTVVYDGTTLTEGTDYIVSYKDNIQAGTGASVVVTGKTLTGTRKVTFTIKKIDQSPACTVSAVDAGKSKTFSVTSAYGTVIAETGNAKIATATVSGKKITVKGVKTGKTKLTITVSGDRNHRPATITRTLTIKVGQTSKLTIAAGANGKGLKLTWAKVANATKYIIYRNNKKVKTITSGSTVTWTDTVANTNGTKYTYKVYAYGQYGTSGSYKSAVYYKVNMPTIKSLKNSASKKMTVTWNKNAKANGYKVQYSLKSNFSSAKTVTITKNSTVSNTIGSLTKGKTYYVRVRGYKKVGSTYYYSCWSATKKVKISK